MTEANRVTVTDDWNVVRDGETVDEARKRIAAGQPAHTAVVDGEEEIDVHESYTHRMANAWRTTPELAIAKPMIVGDDDQSTELVIGDDGEPLSGPELLAHRMANAWKTE